MVFIVFGGFPGTTWIRALGELRDSTIVRSRRRLTSSHHTYFHIQVGERADWVRHRGGGENLRNLFWENLLGGLHT